MMMMFNQEVSDKSKSEYEAVVSFVDRFLGFESDSKLREFKLKSESVKLKDIENTDLTPGLTFFFFFYSLCS